MKKLNEDVQCVVQKKEIAKYQENNEAESKRDANVPPRYFCIANDDDKVNMSLLFTRKASALIIHQ